MLDNATLLRWLRVLPEEWSSMSSQSPKRRQRRYDPLTVLVYVATYQQKYRQRSPSQRRIQIALKISAPSVVHNLIHRLEQRGLITITTHGQGRAADLTLTEAGREAVIASFAKATPSDSGSAGSKK